MANSFCRYYTVYFFYNVWHAFEYFLTILTKEKLNLMVLFIWGIWSARNKMIYEGFQVKFDCIKAWAEINSLRFGHEEDKRIYRNT